MRHSGKPPMGRSNSLGVSLKRHSLTLPNRSAPESPDGTSLKASLELYQAREEGDVQISKKIVVAEAVMLEDLQKGRCFQVWGSKTLEGHDIWREEKAPKDETLFISMSASVVTNNAPTPREIAKSVVRKILREGWIPSFTWNMEESEFPPFPFDLIEDVGHLSDLCSGVTKELEKEGHVVQIEGPVRVFGDIHGQFLDLLQFFHLFGSPEKMTGRGRDLTFVFLGDFVDRGFYSLEVLILLFSLKLVNPKKIILVRGNHESRSMSWQFGFREEIMSKFGPVAGPQYFELFNDVFDHLPLTCCIGKRIICMHGGLGPNVETLEQIAQIPKPLKSALQLDADTTWNNLVARDLLWSDPGQSCDKGFTDHPVRGSGVFRIGADMVTKFLKRNNLQLVMRGHECVSLGFAFNCLGRVMTIFSAVNYCGDSGNAGAVVDVSKNLVCLPKIVRHVYDPLREKLLVRGENRLRESIHEDLDLGTGPAPVVALFDFKAEKGLEISVSQGAEVIVLNDENPEWLWVQLVNGTEKDCGYAPRSFFGRKGTGCSSPH